MTLNLSDMNEVAEAMVAPGKGILAAPTAPWGIAKKKLKQKIQKNNNNRGE